MSAYDSAGLFDAYVTAEHPLFEWDNLHSEYNASVGNGDAANLAP